VTPDELALVQETVRIAAADPDALARGFYDRLFNIAPHTRALFPEDMTEQRGKLVDEFEFLVAAATDLDTFVTRARELGARHVDYGVTTAHYDDVETALMGALADRLGDEWNGEREDAWRRLYRLIAETMLDGAAGRSFARR
jgi:hemoglobin-like flavoprotein